MEVRALVSAPQCPFDPESKTEADIKRCRPELRDASSNPSASQIVEGVMGQYAKETPREKTAFSGNVNLNVVPRVSLETDNTVGLGIGEKLRGGLKRCSDRPFQPFAVVLAPVDHSSELPARVAASTRSIASNIRRCRSIQSAIQSL